MWACVHVWIALVFLRRLQRLWGSEGLVYTVSIYIECRVVEYECYFSVS